MTTAALEALGVPAGDRLDRLPPLADNPGGFWESQLLSEFNEQLLRRFGGTWSAPPTLAAGWERSPALDGELARARERFGRVHPGFPWAWKDPRTCILVPLWRRVLAQPSVLLTHRNPLEVWRSLAARDGMSKAYALALWERHCRSALRGAAGLPGMVARYGQLVDDPACWLRELLHLLEAAGATRAHHLTSGVPRIIDRGRRHAVYTAADVAADPEMSLPQKALYAALLAHDGWHEYIPVVDLPPETPATEVLLAARRAMLMPAPSVAQMPTP